MGPRSKAYGRGEQAGIGRTQAAVVVVVVVAVVLAMLSMLGQANRAEREQRIRMNEKIVEIDDRLERIDNP